MDIADVSRYVESTGEVYAQMFFSGSNDNFEGSRERLPDSLL